MARERNAHPTSAKPYFLKKPPLQALHPGLFLKLGVFSLSDTLVRESCVQAASPTKKADVYTTPKRGLGDMRSGYGPFRKSRAHALGASSIHFVCFVLAEAHDLCSGGVAANAASELVIEGSGLGSHLMI
jgi:hypothetical protein